MSLKAVKGESINIESTNDSESLNSSSVLKVKCLVQQCTSAKLFTKLQNNDEALDEFVQIERGIVLFVCFMKDADESDVDKLVKSLLAVKLSETNDNKYSSILDLPGSILIIPQATLGGKMKGKIMQYHKNIEKDKGLELYNKFIDLCNKYANEHSKWSTSGNKIFNGTYGIRQVFSTVTNGPFLHIIEF